MQSRLWLQQHSFEFLSCHAFNWIEFLLKFEPCGEGRVANVFDMLDRLQLEVAAWMAGTDGWRTAGEGEDAGSAGQDGAGRRVFLLAWQFFLEEDTRHEQGFFCQCRGFPLRKRFRAGGFL